MGMRFIRIAAVLGVLAAAALLFLALRPGGDDGADEPAEPARFAVEIGEEGPGTIEQLRVRQGQQVELTVTMPYEGDVHLHGYDIMDSTGPDEPPAELSFVAETPGRFDLEAHGRWETIAQLVVEP